MLLRALIVLLAYALSGAGFMFMIAGAFPFLGGEYPLLAKLDPLVWVFAWVAHARIEHCMGARCHRAKALARVGHGRRRVQPGQPPAAADWRHTGHHA